MHTTANPMTEQDVRYGDPDAPPTPWADAEAAIATAELWWFTTMRPQGGPHATPLLAVWDAGALHICTGAEEQKWRNLAADPRCAAITGRNDRGPGTDIVLEGVAERVTDDGRLRELARAWEAKYGEEWHFDVADGAFVAEGHSAHVIRVRPTVAYAFGKGPYSHTRYRWSEADGDAVRGLAGAPLRAATAAVRLPAQDLHRARRFYAEQLGLEPAETRDGGLRYVCGATEFVVFASTGRASGEHTQMAFSVSDLAATVVELTERGVVFEQFDLGDLPVDGVIVDIPGHYPSSGALGERAAWFRDSEGNLLGVSQLVRPGTPAAAAEVFTTWATP